MRSVWRAVALGVVTSALVSCADPDEEDLSPNAVGLICPSIEKIDPARFEAFDFTVVATGFPRDEEYDPHVSAIYRVVDVPGATGLTACDWERVSGTDRRTCDVSVSTTDETNLKIEPAALTDVRATRLELGYRWSSPNESRVEYPCSIPIERAGVIPDMGVPDAGSDAGDAGADAGAFDAGRDAGQDAGTGDAGFTDAGFLCSPTTTIELSDGDFDIAWKDELFFQSSAAQQWDAPTTEPTGGIPGAFRQHVHRVFVENGADAAISTAHYFPSELTTSGEICRIDFQVHLSDERQVPANREALVRFLIRQAGTTYASGRFRHNQDAWVLLDPPWTYPSGQSENTWSRVAGSGPTSPDLGMGASPMEFGYLVGASRSGSVGGESGDVVTMIDNWSVVVHVAE